MWARAPWTVHATPCGESNALVARVVQLAAKVTPCKPRPHPDDIWHPTVADFVAANPERRRNIVAWAFNFGNLLVAGGVRGKAPSEAAGLVFEILEDSAHRELSYAQDSIQELLRAVDNIAAVSPYATHEALWWERSFWLVQLAARMRSTKSRLVCVEWPRRLRRRTVYQTPPFEDVLECLRHLYQRGGATPAGTTVLTAKNIAGWAPFYVAKQAPLDAICSTTPLARHLRALVRACRGVHCGKVASAEPALATLAAHANGGLNRHILALLKQKHVASLLGSDIQAPEALGLYAYFCCFKYQKLGAA
jgi:hypothetical protein